MQSIRSVALIGAVGLAVWGLGARLCPAQDQDAHQKIDPESLENVREIAPGGEASVTIKKKTDQAWFRVPIDKAGYLDPAFDTGKARHLEMAAVIYNAKGRRLRPNEARVTPGDVFVRVGEAEQNEKSDHPVKVRFHFTAEIDDTEPANDKRGQGQKVKPNGKASFNLMPVGDQDWFSIKIDEPGYLRSVVDKGDAGHLDLGFRMVDAEGKPLGRHEARVTPGVVHVRIRESQNNESSPDPLTATFHFNPERDDTEPANDKRGQGQKVKPNGSASFSIMPLGDQDWFAIRIKEAGTLRVGVDKGDADHLDLDAAIVDDEGNELGSWEQRVSPGVVHVCIRERDNNESSPAPIKASFHFFPSNDPHEPNETAKSAATVPIGKPFKTTMMPMTDRDWLRVEVPEAGYLWLERIDQPEDANRLEIRRRYYNEIEQPLGYRDMVHVAGAGPVLIELVEKRQDESTPGPITWKLHFKPEMDLLEPNHSPTLAASLDLNEWTRAALAPANEKDYYRLKVEKPGWLMMDTRREAEALALRGTLLDAKGQKELATGRVVRAQPGQYLYRLHSANDDTLLEPFDLRFRLLKESDDLAPADGKPARLTTRPMPFDVSLYNSNDTDHWRFTAEETGYLQLRVAASAEGAKPRLRVAKGQRVVFDGPVTPRHAEGLTPIRLSPGKHQIIFSDNADDWPQPPRRYRVLAHFKPEHDTNEPNDEAKRATPLELGRRMPVTIYGSRDTDWFSFNIDKPGYLRLRLRDTGAFAAYDAIGLDLTLMRRVEGQMRPIQQYPASSDLVGHVIKVEEAGRYFLRIRSLQLGFDEKPFGLVVTHYADKPPPRAPGGLVTAMVGLEVDEDQQQAYQQLAEATGAVQLQADKVDQLGPVMDQAVTEAVEAANEAQVANAAQTQAPTAEKSISRWPLYTLLIAAGLVLSIGALWLKRRKLQSR